MTPRQKELARHALGLKDGRTVSFRNSFHAGPGHADYDDWIAMRDAGHARHQPAQGSGYDVFWMTYAGAHLVVEDGERLDPEDFPS